MSDEESCDEQLTAVFLDNFVPEQVGDRGPHLPLSPQSQEVGRVGSSAERTAKALAAHKPPDMSHEEFVAVIARAEKEDGSLGGISETRIAAHEAGSYPPTPERYPTHGLSLPHVGGAP